MNEKELLNKINMQNSNSSSKTPKDIYSALFIRMNRKKNNDPFVEYMECLEDLSVHQSALEISINKHDKNNYEGKNLLNQMKSIYATKVETAQPKVDSQNSRYNCRDGSQPRFEDLDRLITHIERNFLTNKITTIYEVCAKARGILGIQDDQFYKKDILMKET